MPYSEKGEKVMKKMMKTYKSKKKAKQVFHAMINEDAPGTEEWHSPLMKYGKKKKKGV